MSAANKQMSHTQTWETVNVNQQSYTNGHYSNFKTGINGIIPKNNVCHSQEHRAGKFYVYPASDFSFEHLTLHAP